MENAKKRSFFRRTDRPDLLPEDTTPTLSYFFKLLWRKAGKLLTLNLFMIFLAAPIVVTILLYFYSPTVPTVTSPLYAPFAGLYLAGNSPSTGIFLSFFGEPLDVPVPTDGRIAWMILLMAFLFLTFGWQHVGAYYNIRSLVRGDSCFLLSDYFYAIKKNWKQGLFFGMIDFIVITLLGFDLYYFLLSTGDFLSGIFYAIIIFLCLLYTVMRFYIYPMMITFDLSIRKLLKNALIFSLLGIKRNLMALLGIALILGANLFLIFFGLSRGVSVFIVLPFFYLLPLLSFIGVYAAYPNIKRYMIDPYKENATPPEAD